MTPVNFKPVPSQITLLPAQRGASAIGAYKVEVKYRQGPTEIMTIDQCIKKLQSLSSKNVYTDVLIFDTKTNKKHTITHNLLDMKHATEQLKQIVEAEEGRNDNVARPLSALERTKHIIRKIKNGVEQILAPNFSQHERTTKLNDLQKKINQEYDTMTTKGGMTVDEYTENGLPVIKIESPEERSRKFDAERERKATQREDHPDQIREHAPIPRRANPPLAEVALPGEQNPLQRKRELIDKFKNELTQRVQYTTEYLMSKKSIVESFKEQHLEAHVTDLYYDPISWDVANIPILVHGKSYSLDTLLEWIDKQPRNPNKTFLTPENIEFKLSQIQMNVAGYDRIFQRLEQGVQDPANNLAPPRQMVNQERNVPNEPQVERAQEIHEPQVERAHNINEPPVEQLLEPEQQNAPQPEEALLAENNPQENRRELIDKFKNECTQGVKDFIDRQFRAAKSNAEEFQDHHIQAQVTDFYYDPISKGVANIPVLVHGKTYSLDSLFNFIDKQPRNQKFCFV